MTYYTTTPIYYVNSSPHLGHAYTTIAADVVTRYQRLVGNDAFYLTGTDEHGTNIAQAAEAAGVPTQQFVDANAQKFRDLLPVLDAQADFFIRTTDAEHVAKVLELLQRLYDQGDIYEGTYSGHYCAPCEAYYNEGDLLEGNLCPVHKRPTVVLDEKNYFFKLSKYSDRLQEHFAANPEWVTPRTRYNEALSFIQGGLEDISISRSSITWGVPVPWDETQVVYVWFDALLNYFTALTYAREEDLTATHWPPSLQILAKDILKFHAVIWPAMLMALDIELPKRLLIHGYLLMGGDKMSKTQGNVFDPFPVIEQHGPDALRFYVLREVQFGQDGSVSVETFEQRYTSELANDLGNLVSRATAMASRYLEGGVVGAAPAADAIATQAKEAIAAWRAQMDRVDLSGALETLWVFVRALNKHVEDRAPWKLAKDESQAGLLADTLAELVEGIAAVAYALSPVMPATSVEILRRLGLADRVMADWAWGWAEGAVVHAGDPLFPRLESTANA